MDPRNLRCSFCDGRIEGNTGTLGASVGICHGCANRAAELLARSELQGTAPAASVGAEVRCEFCYTSTASSTLLFSARGRFVCAKCIMLIRKEVIGQPISARDAPANGIVLLWAAVQ